MKMGIHPLDKKGSCKTWKEITTGSRPWIYSSEEGSIELVYKN
jgi:hypothetical protein